MPNLICDIVTPEVTLASEEAYMVIVPGSEGEMGFLSGHEPLVAVLFEGTVRVHKEKDGEAIGYVVQGGYVEVTGQKVIVLADRACSVSEIDKEDVTQKLYELESRISQMLADDSGRYSYATDLAWYKAQIHAIETK